MKKEMIYIILNILLVFAIINISNLYAFNEVKFGLISLSVGGGSLLLFLFLVYKLFQRGFFDDLK